MVCETRIFGTMVGAGDGRGRSFAHPNCLRVEELEGATAKLRKLVEELSLALKEKLEQEGDAKTPVEQAPTLDTPDGQKPVVPRRRRVH